MQNHGQATKQSNHISLALRILVAIGALGFVFWDLNWGELGGAFKQLNPLYFIFALIVFAVSQVLLALRWWLLLIAQGIKIRLYTAIQLHFMGLFYNNIMPSSIGGDFLRAWYITKHTDKRVEAALSVFVDRAIGLFSILLMGAFSYFALLKTVPADPEGEQSSEVVNNVGALGPVIITCLVVMGLLLVILCVIPALRTKMVKLLLRGGQLVKTALIKLKTALLIYLKRPGVLIASLLLTLILQSCTIGAFWLLGNSIGIEATLKHYFTIFPTMWVVGALPISVAGFGILENGIKYMFMHLAQATAAQATCLALCQRFVWIITSLPGSAIHLMGKHLPSENLPRDLETGGAQAAK